MAYNTENTFVALIDQNGMIRDMSTGRRGEVIGVDYQKEDEYKRTISEMQETIDNYYGKLVELGAITIPKSPEQIAQEAAAEQLRLVQEQATQQAAINQALLESVQNTNAVIGDLQNQIKELRASGNSGSGIESGAKQIGGDSQSDRPTGKSGKGGTATGTKDAT